MDKAIKEENDNQTGENSQVPNLHPAAEPCDKQATAPGCNPPLTESQQRSASVPCDAPDKKKEKPYQTYSLRWKWKGKTERNRGETVEDSLKKSSEFRKIEEKKVDKELLIVRDRKPISKHFICSLVKKTPLAIRYIKAADKTKQPARYSAHRQRKGPSGELVVFNVWTSGGMNIVHIYFFIYMKKPTLNTVFDEITVFAYKDEKVKHALKRNGRFQDVVFTKICALLNKNIEATTSMHSLVNNLDGKYFKIILLNKSDCDENPDPSKWSTITESVNDNIPPKLDGNMVLDKKSHEIPNFKEMMHQLSFQFKDLIISKEPQESKLSCIQTFFCVKCEIPNSEEMMHQLYSPFFPDFMKSNKPQQSKLSCNQNISHVEFGKNAQTCREVKTMKKLTALSDSVCQVRVNDTPAGSGFLLFGRCVLTNAHVVQNIYNESTGQLNETVTVHFSFESLNQTPSGAAVKEVAGFEFGPDASGHECDWALLRLAADQKLPGALLKHYGFLPQSGAICIIGHPDGGVKKIDPCLIVSTENRTQVAERHHRENPAGVLPEDNHYSENRGHIQLVTNQFFEDVAKDVNLNRQALTYESCFYFGSSGSPVFDEHCNVIAVHSGGYAYRNVRGERQSVIEYGQPLSLIIEHIIVQMVEKGRFDVLKEYLACDYARHPNTMSSLKKLVESRNLTAFKNAVNNLPSTSDESLKTFFEFFSQTEAPVPMDID
ncbi:serine protease FAM111A-like [Plectropomus leopardus]|uniref:serine protease FAM111A-like n=1 Tax=Plectropomus leopardus TaxID=160734 RepID=UPI001C4BC9A1|nr:serine protease FAM111A-like [Plectropomus leopardus]